MNGITTVRSGAYLSVGSCLNNGVGSHAGNKADSTGEAANLPRDKRTLTRWFNTNAFVDQLYTRYGTSGEGVVVGPGAINISLFKYRCLKTRGLLRINRSNSEAFNAFNHVNLGNPGTKVSDEQPSDRSVLLPRSHHPVWLEVYFLKSGDRRRFFSKG